MFDSGASTVIHRMGVLSHRVCGQLLLAVFVFASTVSAAPINALPAAIQTLEADGKLNEARKYVAALTPPLDADDLKAHLDLIDKTTNVLAVVDAYVKNGLSKQAIEALTAFLPSVSQARDAGLAIAVQRRLAQLQQPGPTDRARQAAIEQAARDALTRADTLFARSLYKNAKDAYTPVAAQTDISEDTKDRARRGVAKATQKEFEEQRVGTLAKISGSLRDGATTVSEWLLTFISFGVPLAVLLWVFPRLLLRNERSLELTDLSLPSSSPPANRELTQELQDVIDRIRGAGPGSAKLDVTGAGDSPNEAGEELPAAGLVFVTPPVDAPELGKQLDAFVSSTPTVQFGGIGFNPQQLWALIKRLFTRRARHAFSGTLVTYDNTLTLRLTREDRLWGRKTPWRSHAPSASAEARISCLVGIACQIVLDDKNTSTATSDCHSLKDYILGLYALSANTADAITNAGAHFQAALDRDEGNWLARFQLALCARGRKDTRTAIRHLTWFTGADAGSSESLRAHVTRHPDFPYVVQYQLASTMALASEDREDPDVGRILDGLIALEDAPEDHPIDHARRLRLVMLARSGQSSRDAVRCFLVRDDQVLRDARQRLRDHLDWFNDHADELQRAAPTQHPLARGIVLHAYGRTQFSSGDKNGAIESLREAVDLMPTYADVRVDLAKAYLERKGEINWPQRVTEQLDRALELDPKNAKAKFVYARFYFAEETRDFAKAETYLTAASFDPASLFMLAQALNNRGSYAETLGVLARAIALQENGPTFRVRLYADSLLELVTLATDPNNTTIPKPSARVLDRARRQLCKYDNKKIFDDDERQKANYQRSAERYAEICAKLKVQPGQCFSNPAPPPP